MNTVLIPAFRRPEFLQATLKHIATADGAGQYRYIFRLDHGYDPRVTETIAGFPFQHEITYTPQTRYTATKQSYSLLTGLQLASRDSELVFLIEEDVVIGKDFFTWHEHVHANGDLFSSHGNLNVNTTPAEGSWDHYYLTTDAYSSIGTCIPSHVIKRYIQPHINHDYFRAPWAYIKKRFPKSTLGSSFVEQDGLIRRIQVAADLPQAYPCHQYIDDLLYGPRCYHTGFVGKNRVQTSITGTHDSRENKVNNVIYNVDAMKDLCGKNWRDSVPCALELPSWTALTLKN